MTDFPTIKESATKQKTRKKILDTACHMFVTKGYMETQMKDIMAAADISKKNLYRYYASKEELAFHIEISLFEDMQAALLCPKHEDETGFDYIERFLRHQFKTYVFDNEAALKFFVQFDAMTMDAYPDIPISADFVTYMQSIRFSDMNIFDIGQKDGSIRRDKTAGELENVCVHLLMASAERYASRKIHIKKELGIGEEIIDMTIDVLLSYIRPRSD